MGNERILTGLKWEAITAPLAVLLFIITLVLAARFYDHVPIRLPPCGFKRVTGLPCVSCRGTRAMRALIRGDVATSFRYNPLVSISLSIAILWIGGYALRKGRPPQRPMPVWLVVALTVSLLLGNWIYLIATNHWF